MAPPAGRMLYAPSGLIQRVSAATAVSSHEPYGGIELSPAGHRRAVEMVRRHRLVETYLVHQLGYSWDEVHDEADVLEHAVSALMIERMDYVLGRPWRDPHGDPIPTANGTVHQPNARPLGELADGETGYVARIGDEDAELLRWFTDHGVDLDVQITVSEQKPFGGALTVDFTAAGGRTVVELGFQAVAALWVTDERPSVASARESGCPYPDCRHLGEV